VSLRSHSDLELAGVVTGLTVLGMVAGTWLLLFGENRNLGWMLFTLSFGFWMAAAIVFMLLLWDAGYLDR
jgi:hypothetical protein